MLRRSRQSFFACGSHDCVDPALDSSSHRSPTKLGNHVVAQDLSGECIGQHAFESVADFDARASVLGGGDDEDPVVDFRLADLPGFGDAQDEGLDGLTFEGRDGQYDDLMLSLGLEAFEAADEGLLLRCGQEPGIVLDLSLQGRDVDDGCRGPGDKRKRRSEKECEAADRSG